MPTWYAARSNAHNNDGPHAHQGVPHIGHGVEILQTLTAMQKKRGYYN